MYILTVQTSQEIPGALLPTGEQVRPLSSMAVTAWAGLSGVDCLVS